MRIRETGREEKSIPKISLKEKKISIKKCNKFFTERI